MAADDQETGSPTGEIAVSVAANHRRSKPSAGGGGGREDCWSEGATAVLVEAWGERYVELRRGSLSRNHWEEVAEIVGAHAAQGKPAKTHVQCKYRIDTVKKKYKSEKAKLAAGGGPSNWPLFDRVDRLLGNPNSLPSLGIPVGRLIHRHQRKKPPPPPLAVDSGSEADDLSIESSESLPPTNQRKRKTTELESVPPRRRRFGSVRELTRAIMRFGEAYEEAERAKMEQVVEMEKQRMEFAKEIEIQRMKFLVKTQVEISQIRRVGGRVREADGSGSGSGSGGGDTNHRLINDESNMNNCNSSN